MDSTSRMAYDPLQLTHDVFQLLLDKGLPVERAEDAEKFSAAVGGAEQILRYLGLEPTIPDWAQGYRTLDMDGQLAYNRRIHGD